jgi:hypothetical protein
MEKRDYSLIHNNMQKSFQVFLAVVSIVTLAFVVGFVYWSKDQAMPAVQNQAPSLSQSVQPQSDSTAAWKTYRNEEYGFEMKYPNSWISVNALGPYNSIELLKFTTGHGYKATFGLEKFPPIQEGKMIDEYRSIHLKSNSNLQTYDTLIGSELGFETGDILCEVRNPCVARFEFLSDMLLKKGFKFFLVISGFNGRESSSTLIPSNDPYSLFDEEVLTARKVLSTFKLTE